MYTDRPTSGETVDTGVDNALPAPPASPLRPTSVEGAAVGAAAGNDLTVAVPTPAVATTGRGYLDPASTTERLRLLWSTGARDVTLVAPGDGEGHRQPGAIDPRGWIA